MIIELNVYISSLVSDKNTFSFLIILRAYLLIIINQGYTTDDMMPIKDDDNDVYDNVVLCPGPCIHVQLEGGRTDQEGGGGAVFRDVVVGDLDRKGGVLRAVGAAGADLRREALNLPRRGEAPLQYGLLGSTHTQDTVSTSVITHRVELAPSGRPPLDL